MLCGGARDHLQIRDLGEARQDFVLYSLGEISVLFVAAEIFEGQHGYRSLLGGKWSQALIQPRPECNRYDSQDQTSVYDDGFSASPPGLRVEAVVAAVDSKK